MWSKRFSGATPASNAAPRRASHLRPITSQGLPVRDPPQPLGWSARKRHRPEQGAGKRWNPKPSLWRPLAAAAQTINPLYAARSSLWVAAGR